MSTLVTPILEGVAVDPSYVELRDIKLGTVRTAFSLKVYERSNARAFLALVVDVALYLGLLTGVFLFDSVWLKLVFGLMAGIAVAALFVWSHDVAHGALFKPGRLTNALGIAAMLPSLNMYYLWIYGHNKVHHGFTSFSPVDWIWRPKSPAQYQAASPWSRMVYRMERSMWGCALHYLLRVWWPGMVTFRPGKTSRRTQHFVSSKLTTLAFALGAGTIAWFFAGGAIGVIAAVVVPWIVFNYFIALFVYLHHTHPSLPFFDDRERWNAAIGQVACSTIVRTSPVFESLTHNIMIHTPHHVDQRIPFYRLKTAYSDLKPEYGKHILEYKFSWKAVHSIFTTCQLFDFDEQRWYRFSDF